MFIRAQHTLLHFVDYLFAKTYPYRVQCKNVVKSITIDTTHCRFKFQIDRDTSDRNVCTARGATVCTMYVGRPIKYFLNCKFEPNLSILSCRHEDAVTRYI